MELDMIRKELDKLGQTLDYIILLRMSLAILVGEVKDNKFLASLSEYYKSLFRSNKN